MELRTVFRPLLVLLICYGFFHFLFIPFSLNPDAFYHLGLAQETLKEGLIRALPQADNIFWRDEFVNKEFLYHYLIVAAFALGGETGVLLFANLLGALTLFSIFFVLLKSTREPWLAFAFTLVALFESYFFFRIHLVRPHTLSILIFVWNIHFLLARNLRGVALTSFLLPLSYHLYYLIPINLILFQVFLRDSKIFRWGMLATLAGILFNPYFPKTLVMFIHIFIMSFQVEGIHPDHLPREFVKASFLKTLPIHLMALAFLGGAAFHLSRTKVREKSLLFVVSLTGLWYLLFIINRRATEYLLPLLLFTGTLLLRSHPKLLKPALALVLISSLLNFGLHINLERGKKFKAFAEFEKKALHSLSQDERSKILNCSWDAGSRVFYYRPNLKFVDLLNPYFLLEQNPSLSRLREKFVLGETPDPLATLRTFEAKYTFCHKSGVNVQLEFDPRMKRIFPAGFVRAQGFNAPSIYTEISGIDRFFLKKLKVDERWIEAPKDKQSNQNLRSVFFWSEIAAGSPNASNCVNATVDLNSARRRPQYIGLGGTGEIEVQTDGKSKHRVGEKGMVRKFIPLSGTPSELRLQLCTEGKEDNTYSISLWNDAILGRICRAKGKVRDEVYRELLDTDKLRAIDICRAWMSHCPTCLN